MVQAVLVRDVLRLLVHILAKIAASILQLVAVIVTVEIVGGLGEGRAALDQAGPPAKPVVLVFVP